jgi:D-sedoheptulose 7-phosphate isomerase
MASQEDNGCYSIGQMNLQSFDEHADVFARTRGQCAAELDRLIAIVSAGVAAGNKILFFGNGGSASDAQHLAAELSVRFVKTRSALAGLALGANIAEITACGNDFGFDQIFARQIEALGRPGDVAIAFSTSGKSPNIVAAVRAAKAQAIFTAAFTGESGGELRGLVDLLIAVPSQSTARIQEMHSLLGHMLCEGIEEKLQVGR